MCDLINIYYTAENTFYYIGARSLEIVSVIRLTQGRTHWNNMTGVMYDWVERRPDVMYRQLERHLMSNWEDSELYQINLTQNTEGGNVYMNEFKLPDNKWTGHHYYYTGAEMTAAALPGWKFEKWVINGKDVNNAVVFPERHIAGTVDIEAVFVKDDSLEGVLVINEIYYDSRGTERSYIELYNPTNSEVSADMYTVIIYNSDANTQTEYTLEGIAAPFSHILVDIGLDKRLKGGRDEITLIRSGSDDIVDNVHLPELKSGESYGRYPDGNDGNGGNFVYLQRLTPNAVNELGNERIVEQEYMKNRILLTGRLQDKEFAPIRAYGEVFIPLALIDEYNGNNPASIQRIARSEAEEIDGIEVVALSAFGGTGVRINQVILERLNSVIFYR
jgi:hypothetical protein